MMHKIEEYKYIKKYNIDPVNLPIIAGFDFHFSQNDKLNILDKLLEAYDFAYLNLNRGNITNRAFGANICVEDAFGNCFWEKGTNFNNTRNDISSICAERSALIRAYNTCFESDINEFKVKYICMAEAKDLSEINESVIPCEDCLSWFNTDRFFDYDAIIFTFCKNSDNALCLHVQKLVEILPYKGVLTSNVLSQNIVYSKNAQISMEKHSISKDDIKKLISSAYSVYSKHKTAKITNQNIASAILTNKKIYKASKIDWTKRWFMEPLEYILATAFYEEQEDLKVKAIAYFGDEFANISENKFHDGVVSIKSLGRIRQKYAGFDTLLVLNFKDKIFVLTLKEYLPQKFMQGYEIK